MLASLTVEYYHINCYCEPEDTYIILAFITVMEGFFPTESKVTTFLNPLFKSPAIPSDMSGTQAGCILPGYKLGIKGPACHKEKIPQPPLLLGSQTCLEMLSIQVAGGFHLDAINKQPAPHPAPDQEGGTGRN